MYLYLLSLHGKNKNKRELLTKKNSFYQALSIFVLFRKESTYTNTKIYKYINIRHENIQMYNV